MNRGVGTWLALAATALGACATPRPPPVSLVEGERGYVAHDYEQVLARWSRAGGVLTVPELEDRLRVDATYLSWDFLWAYWARYAHDARMIDAEMARQRDAALSATRDELIFYVALATEHPRWGELGRPLSAWRVSLVDDQGREELPVRIERERRSTAYDQTYFPYTTPWRQVFRLHFARRIGTGAAARDVLAADTRYVVLRFGGPLGNADLRWDLTR